MRNSWILIVDDDANFCRSMLRALETRGIQATSCQRAAQALDLIRAGRSRPCMLITDAHLPDLNGLELIRALANEDISLPTLLISGIGASLPVEQMRSLGCHGFLEKPFPVGVFLEQVLALLPKDPEESRTPGTHHIQTGRVPVHRNSWSDSDIPPKEPSCISRSPEQTR